MKSKKAVLALGILGFASLMALATPARADFGLFVGRPGFSLFGGDRVPPPPPVIYAEPRVYYAPPVYGYPRYPKHYWKHWKKHHGHHRHHKHHHHDD